MNVARIGTSLAWQWTQVPQVLDQQTTRLIWDFADIEPARTALLGKALFLRGARRQLQAKLVTLGPPIRIAWQVRNGSGEGWTMNSGSQESLVRKKEERWREEVRLWRLGALTCAQARASFVSASKHHSARSRSLQAFLRRPVLHKERDHAHI